MTKMKNEYSTKKAIKTEKYILEKKWFKPKLDSQAKSSD